MLRILAASATIHMAEERTRSMPHGTEAPNFGGLSWRPENSKLIELKLKSLV